MDTAALIRRALIAGSIVVLLMPGSALAQSVSATASVDDPPAAEPGAATTPPIQQTEPEPAESEEGVRWELYGRLKADASLDTTSIDPGNFARWVESPDLTESHSHFNLTVRESRLGLHIHAPDGGPKLSGHLEVDFYGGGAENRNILMLRHAHIDVEWDNGWSLIAGQYSDVISPLVPTTVNYSVAWWVGNIGYRHPQFRATRKFGSADSGLVLAAAVSRTIGDDFSQEPGDSGVDSGRPTLQGRAGWDWSSGGRRGSIGISGHEGVEDLGDDFQEPGLEFESWSIGADLLLPIGDRWLIKGEAWKGENLDDHLGGIGQGINIDAGVGVRAAGGWGSIEFRPSSTVLISAGAGIDDPDDRDLRRDDVRVRTYNRAIWANALLDLGRGLSTGFEVSHWRTDHGDLESGEGFRFQTALIFAF
jgi:hypothetical protein